MSHPPGRLGTNKQTDSRWSPAGTCHIISSRRHEAVLGSIIERWAPGIPAVHMPVCRGR